MRERLEVMARVASHFLRWWVAELQSCANDVVEFFAPHWRRALTIYLDANRLLILDQESATPTTVLEIAYAGSIPDLPQVIPAPLAAAVEHSHRVRVVIGVDKAYLQQVRLPLAALPHLDSAIAIQLPKLLPLDSMHLLTDFKIAATDATKGTANIDLAALKRSDIDPLLKRLRAWGLRVTSLHLGQTPGGEYRFEFESGGATSRQLSLRRTDRILVGAAATLGLACASIAATESYRSQAALDHEKMQTHLSATAALTRRQQLLARLDPLSALSQLEGAPPAAALLAEVTKLIPQSTWLTTFELKDHALRIVGLSPNSADVVKLLSSSAFLNEVQLRSSMSVGVGTGLDRFEITAESKANGP
jgi:general secretion pathway protein L